MSIGIGVVGVGVWGCHSLEQTLARAGDARVTAVSTCDRWGATCFTGDPVAHGREYAAKFGAVFYPDWQDVIGDPAVDIVSAMVCPKEKAPVILAALEAGKTVVTDKPLAFNADEARRICRAEETGNGRGFMLAGYHMRPAVARLLEEVRAGRVGAVRAVNIRLCFMGGIFPGFQPSLRWRNEIPSAEMTTIGAHALVTLGHLVPVPARKVFALTRNWFYDAYRQVGAEDAAELTVEFDAGAVGSVFVARLPYRIPGEDICIEVTGTDGYARLVGDRMTLWPDPVSVTLDSTGPDVLLDTFRQFFAALREDRPMPTSFADGLRLQVLLDAALRSARTGNVCAIGE